MLHRLLISTALVAGMASTASAATVSYSTSLANQATDFSGTSVSGIQKFESSLGTLNSATIQLIGNVSGTAQYESLNGSPASIILNLSAEVALSTSALGVLIVTLPTLTESRSASAFDGTIDFGGTSGATINGLTQSDTNSTILTGSDLAEFIGSGFVGLTMAGTSLSSASGPGNMFAGFTTFAGGQILVTYDYTEAPPPPPAAVPLPAGMPLMLLGLGALGLASRRKA